MKHLNHWRRTTATGIGAVLVVGSLGSVAAASPMPAPIALVAESDLQVTERSADTSIAALRDEPAARSGSVGASDSIDSIDSTDDNDTPDPDDSSDSTDDDDTAGPFPDVPGNSVHAANIARLAELAITTGDLDGNFGPTDLVTRGQFASMLARALSLDPVDGQRFTDVRPDNVHAANINAVAAAGITTGVTDTTFEPDQFIRRDQLASMLIRGLEPETS